MNNRTTIAIAMLILAASTEVMGARGVCIVCPPGYDCPNGGTPTLAVGTTGQVLTRGTTGVSWQALPPVASDVLPKGVTGTTGAAGISTNYAREDHVHQLPTAAEIGAVPSARTINSKALSENITLSASDVDVVPTDRTIAGLSLSENITKESLLTQLGLKSSYCNATSKDVSAECFSSSSSPSGNGWYCWCSFWSDDYSTCGNSSRVYVSNQGNSNSCGGNCYNDCNTKTTWRSSSTW